MCYDMVELVADRELLDGSSSTLFVACFGKCSASALLTSVPLQLMVDEVVGYL